MWQMDNDRQALRRLEHELSARHRVDRLLNSVTTSDREEPLFRLNHKPITSMVRRLLGQLYSRLAVGSIVPRASE